MEDDVRPLEAAGIASVKQIMGHNGLGPGVVPVMGHDWDDRLEEWLSFLLAEGGPPPGVQDWSFPTDELRDQYLASVHLRSEEEVIQLLRMFVFEASAFELSDQMWLATLIDPDGHIEARSEFERSLVAWAKGDGFPHPGVRWALDMLPSDPRRALAAIDAYLAAELLHLPDGRVNGLADALAVVRARYIGLPATVEEQRLSLLDLTSRQFEIFVARLYDRLGYSTTLTSPRKDGGRDVLATRTRPGERDELRIECKLYSGHVGVEEPRKLLGVVVDEKATRGVLVGASGFTRAAHQFADRNPSLELLDGANLVVMANEHLGRDWPARLEWILRPTQPPE